MIDTGGELRITVEAWLELTDPDLTMDEAEDQLRELGNEILERDDEGHRFKVLYYREEA